MCAGFAVSEGLPYEEAWKAITINPATALGIADRVEALKQAKTATSLSGIKTRLPKSEQKPISRLLTERSFTAKNKPIKTKTPSQKNALGRCFFAP